VAQAYNPSYSGGRYQEDRGSKLAQANSLRDTVWKMLNTKRADGVAQGVGLQFKPQYHTHTHTKRHITRCGIVPRRLRQEANLDYMKRLLPKKRKQNKNMT
jgi:hypothetical protein